MKTAIHVLPALLLVCALGASAAETTKPLRVELRERDGQWQMLRDGKPYCVKGGGGDGSVAILASCGGNSIRTWGVENLGKQLDAADKAGVSVAVGIWLGHGRHGFDYASLDQVAVQYEKAREAILRYKDHPAVLVWGIGNEMESPNGDDASIWSAVNSIAAMAKKVDPNHPTMTVIAELGGRRVEAIHRLCPDIDIVGINSYGGAASVPERYRKAGGKKPYLVTEYGPPGIWEIGRNAWGVPEELSSTKKAEFYRKACEAFAADKALCLGSYAFIWGHKQEATATWFGMLLPDGTKLEAVDALSEVWSGKPPRDRCPRIESLAVVGPNQVKPGETVQAKLDASDPAGKPIDVKWVLVAEAQQYGAGGDAEPETASFAEAIVKSDAKHAEVKMPSGGGGYRLFAYVRNGKGAAVANVPLKVDGVEVKPKSKAATLPLVLVADDAKASYVPTGWMGEVKSIRMNEQCEDQPHLGKVCVKVEYAKPDGWGGVVWQSPPNDWGDRPGGFDLSGAKKLVFWARGQNGGEKIKFGVGLIDADKKFPDSAKAAVDATLTSAWKQYEIDLTGKDLSQIKSGFYFTFGGQGKPLAFYLDDVQFE